MAIQGSGYTSAYASNPTNYLRTPAVDVNKVYGPTATSAQIASLKQTAPVSSGSQQTGNSSSFNLQGVLEPNPSQPGIDFDALIRPALDALDQSVGGSQSAYDANISEIETGRNSQVRGQQSALAEAQTAAEQARQRNTQQANSAVDEQRRGFSELQQGLQSRYGGTTGTGAFAGEIAGAQSLKNIGAIRQGLTNAITQIDDKFEQVRGATQIAIQDIEDQTQSLKLKAKSDLDASLNQIRISKGELQSRKAELASQAIQFYQQQVAEVNSRNAQFKQQLYVQQQAAEQKLQQARQTASEKAKEFTSVQIGVDPASGYNMFGAFDKSTGNVTPYQVGGSLNSKDEEDNFIDL